jgi:hypothetical protein
LFKIASVVEFIFEIGIVIACAIAWAIAGFPRFMEVTAVGGALTLACFGLYAAMMIVVTRDLL